MNGPHEEWEILSAYLDAELSPVERGSVEAHLSACADCREELAGLKATKALAAAAPRRALPPEVLVAVERRLENPGVLQRLRRLWDSSVSTPVLAPAGAVLAAIVALAVWTHLRGADEIPLDPLLAAHARYAEESLVPQAWTGPEFIERVATIDD